MRVMNAITTAPTGTREVRLLSGEVIAAGTMAFRLSRPRAFSFRAGQAIDLVLPSGAQHAFSLVSAPFEPELVIATRIRKSAYKAELQALRPAAKVRLAGPFGALTLHHAANRDAVFIAGGIGVTPFVSILRQAAQDEDPRRFTLLYSNRRPEFAAYLPELRWLAFESETFHLTSTMTEVGDKRPIDVEMIRAASASLAQPIFYLAGAPGMVAAMRVAVAAAGVDEDDVRSEGFFGY
jgi:ferredoxin-NADP reductase